ncbi:MAG: PEGA domain-containing protein [Methanophagales archaeon]|nr:PEGA domain-containing protein [Methanophagales archaeon]
MLTKSGYYDKTATVIVVLNQVAYVSESLDAKTGEIDISSDPSGAMVYLDDSYKGITPITISDVPEGYHTVKLTKPGYWDYCETLYVSARSNEFISKHLSLIPPLTPKPSIQAFGAIFTIAGLLAVAYPFRRRE